MHTWELCPSSARMLSRFDKQRLLYFGVQVALVIAAIVVEKKYMSPSSGF